MFKINRAINCFLILFFLTFTPCSYATFSSTDFLKTNGTVLKNNFGNGTPVILKGTNLGGWFLKEDWMSPLGTTDEYNLRQILFNRFKADGMQNLLDSYANNWIQASDLDNIKQLGLNVVRVPLYWEDFMNSDGSMKSDAISFTKLDWLVAESSKRNIYVILDLHGTPGAACPWQSCGRENFNKLWTNTTYQNWTVQIWQRLAKHFNNNPTIAAYDLINEPLLTMGSGENGTQIQQKMDYFNRLYQAVRAIDVNHTIDIAVFYDWWAAFPPSHYGWSNVVYQTHHYQMTSPNDWNLTNSEIDRWLRDLSTYQRTWNVPIYAGEFSFAQNDLLEKWLKGLNSLNASWTTWSYKVKGGGNWGFYINNTNPSPNLQIDSATTIAAKWAKFTTANFQSATTFANIIKKYSAAPVLISTWSSLKAVANNKYVTANDAGSGPLVANRVTVADSERFKIIKNSDSTISLLSMANKKYVQTDLNNAGRLIASASVIDTWEKFWLVNAGNGQVALKAFISNKFVSADLNVGGVLYANRVEMNNWEKFYIGNA
jgi:endoglucanase